MKQTIRHIAVVSINRDKYSETFIHDSFDFFPCPKTLLYGDYLPTHSTSDWQKEGEPIPKAPTPFWKKKPATPHAQHLSNLYAWMKKNRPDVVLAHYGPSGVMVAPICKKLKIPLVVHFHGYDAYRADALGNYGSQYPALAQLAQFIVVSRDMQDQLKSLGIPEDRLNAFPYGVNMALFPAVPMPDGPFRFLFVGRLVAKKAPDLLLQAFAKVRTQVPDAKLEMVGDGELMPRCEQWVDELGLGESVSFRGVLTHSEIAGTLTNCNALVLPSRRTEEGDSEGTPLVVLEAGAAMRPVISTYHGGIPEVITDEQNGILVPQNEIDALANAMITLACNPQHARKLGLAHHTRIKSEFTQAGYHQNLWQVLENAVLLA